MRPPVVYVLAAAGPGAHTMVPWCWDPVHGSMRQVQLAGLGKFLKKAANVVHKVATAPLRAISPSLVKPLDKIHSNVVNTADKLHMKLNTAAKRIGKWAKKNWKWIVIAAAIVLTIYTMGAGATFAAKMASGYAKIKAIVVAKASGMVTWKKAAVTLAQQAMGRMLNGAAMGDLPPEEVAALAEANGAAGEVVVPPELLAYLQAQAGGADAIQATVDGELEPEEGEDLTASAATATAGAEAEAKAQAAIAAASAAAAAPRPVVQGGGMVLNAAARAAQEHYLRMLAATGGQVPGQVPGQAPGMAPQAAALVPYRPAARQVPVQATEGTPDWLLPAGIAAGALLLVLALR